MTEHNIIITRIADGEQYPEESLEELLRDAGENPHTDSEELIYDKGENSFGWAVNFISLDYNTPDWKRLDLDPAKYRISFANAIDRDTVDRMVQDIRVLVYTKYKDDYQITVDIESIANRYLRQQT